MHGKGEIDEKMIKQLLTSEREEDHDVGLDLIIAKYGLIVWGSLRIWSTRARVFISPDDMVVIWYATLVSVASNVRDGKFEVEGRLQAYLCRIARRRAVDLFRKRILTVAVLESIAAPGLGNLDELLEEIVVFCLRRDLPPGERLTDIQRRQLLLDVSLFLQNMKLVSLATLTVEVNKRESEIATEGAVRGRRVQAWSKLRNYLKGRLYGD